jgi:hypothetical protein
LVVSDNATIEDAVDATLESIRYVGPATASVLESNGFGSTAITGKRVSYRMLVDAGVNPGVAAKIRREHSLSWSFSSGGDLDRRSTQVRGLGTAEAEWVAASAGDWQQETDQQSTGGSSGDIVDPGAASETSEASEETDIESTATTPWPTHGISTSHTASSASTTVDKPTVNTVTDGSGDASSAEAAWRARSRPTPVTELADVDSPAADLLAEAGITSVRSLATADPARIAAVLELPSTLVDMWYQCARDVYD